MDEKYHSSNRYNKRGDLDLNPTFIIASPKTINQ
jgi:hypothetical protein